ncbi:MAG TPA: hypothetical protein VE090_02850 [Methylomirabilota bacterium]|nr:hypothetical protein [Methylomirabilota bacterium]
MKLIIIIVFALVTLNVTYLDWQVFNKISSVTTQNTQTKLATSPEKNTNACSQSCLSIMQQATAAAKLVTAPALTTQTTTSTVKEFFVPFGSGSITATDWQDVPGTQAYIDTANYPRIKKSVFEVSVHVPTGNETVSVRLFNATDQHPVWYSDVFFAGGTDSQFLISQPITLDPGNKLYKVQMKAQLNFPAIVDQSRLHIVIY